MEGGPTHFYDEIEPFCRWRRTENIDILELHLPSGLKKEHLKIHINNNGILTITGTCPVDQTESMRFKKETKVAKNCRINEIRAKFSKGVLYVTMPRTSPIATGPSVALKGVISQTLDPKADDNMTNVAKCASEFHNKFGSLKQRLCRKTVVEGVAALVVVAAALVGVVKAYQYCMASPV
ncbi:17.5 kDa class I heat shock protein [Cardamine amara subsp. amara]|uniref:17.5 kDa class I heat shock protein n=1 Tax=Cardamine amara subsp. amara TaxID=228776 RepID=A0ABD1C779_CARAN